MCVSVGGHVADKLSKNSVVKAKCGGRVYPIWVRSGASGFPFICFECEMEASDYEKGGSAIDHHRVTVSVVAKGYEECLRIAEGCRESLDKVTAEYDDYEVTDATFEGGKEDYSEETDCYVYQMTIGIETESRIGVVNWDWS